VSQAVNDGVIEVVQLEGVVHVCHQTSLPSRL
jgi:hypothetical protein